MSSKLLEPFSQATTCDQCITLLDFNLMLMHHLPPQNKQESGNNESRLCTENRSKENKSLFCEGIGKNIYNLLLCREKCSVIVLSCTIS